MLISCIINILLPNELRELRLNEFITEGIFARFGTQHHMVEKKTRAV